jgi:AraC-like DNA-binding protein
MGRTEALPAKAGDSRAMTRLGNIDYLTDSLAIRRRKLQQRIHLHDHPLTELVLVMSGRCKHLLDGDAFPVQAGDVFVISPGMCHGYADTEELVIANLMFDLDGLGVSRLDLDGLPGYHALFTFEPRLRRQSQFNARLHLSLKRLAEIDGMAAEIEREVLEPGPGSLFAAVGSLMRIIVALSREYSLQRHAESLGMLRLGDTLSHIEARFREPLAVAELANVAHVSERTLFRVFREVLGCSPLEYVLRLRLRRASELLRDTDWKLDEIADRVGFSDGGYLSRQFRKHFRIAPSAYRQAAQSFPPELPGVRQ